MKMPRPPCRRPWQPRQAGLPLVLGMLAALFAGSTAVAAPDRRALIVQGSGGEQTYDLEFTDWARRLRAYLIGPGGLAEQHVRWLGQGPPSPQAGHHEPATLSTIRGALGETIAAMAPDGELMVVLIGHGAHVANTSRFMIPGPDLTAETLGELLTAAGERRIILINATASSAGFINVLSGPGRIIVTATKSVNERNATRFMESFLQGLEDGSADENRDGRISLLEAARQADRLTLAWFEAEGYLVTEHPLIDDNGDRRGTRLVPEAPGEFAATDSPPGEGAALDGSVAARYFLKDFSFPPEVPRELVDRYIAVLDRIEEVKAGKSTMAAGAYRERLEPLLIEAARTNRQIQRTIGSVKSNPGSESRNP